MKPELYQQTLEKKYSNVKFHEKPSSGSRVVPCGRTDTHCEANSRFSEFYERAYKLPKVFTRESQCSLRRTYVAHGYISGVKFVLRNVTAGSRRTSLEIEEFTIISILFNSVTRRWCKCYSKNQAFFSENKLHPPSVRYESLYEKFPQPCGAAKRHTT